MRKIIAGILLGLAILISANTAEAKTHHGPRHHNSDYHSFDYDYHSFADLPTIGAHRAHWHVPWCGLFMEDHTGIHKPGLALARNWASVGRPVSGPAPGVIGVLPHHVFQVVQVLSSGVVLAISGNDGNAVRTRPRSTHGVIAWRSLG